MIFWETVLISSLRRNSIFKSISRSCDVDDGDDDNARADSPFIDVEALSDDDDEIASAAESNDSPPESTVEAEPVKVDLKEEVEVIEMAEKVF